MKLREFKQVVRSIVQENLPATKPNRPEVHPGTPEKPKKRRTLTPPKTAPATEPKAESQIREGDILSKIAQRFKTGK